MNADQLTQLNIDPKWLSSLEETFDRFDINTPDRQSCFIGQCAHESNNFKVLVENLNYGAAGLLATWPKRFSGTEAADYQRQPERIANKVYADRMGNGSESSGDGWNYRGRGLVQLTGKANYKIAGDAFSADLINNPEKVSEMEFACLTAGWFWDSKNLNNLADKQDYVGLTKAINGGIIGLEDRIEKIKATLAILNT